MNIKDDYNLFKLFLEKTITIYVDNTYFKIKAPTIKDLYLNSTINATYHLITLSTTEMEKIIPNSKDSFAFIETIIFQLGMYKEYSKLAQTIVGGLRELLPGVEIDYVNKQFIIEDLIITNEIWEYILYIIKLTCGEKVEKPRTFNSEEERQFYLAQKKMDERIKQIKSQKPGDSEGLIKSFLTIQYKFNLSFDYLAEQTMAQIQWLQKYAAGAVSYEVNAQAFAAGNMKKGKKLDFFIK